MDFVVLDGFGFASRTTTAPVEQLAKAKAYLDGVRGQASSLTRGLFDIFELLEFWLRWPRIAAIALFAGSSC